MLSYIRGHTMRLPIHPTHPEPRKIKQALHTLTSGGVVALPTDSLYALTCLGNNKKAVRQLYAIKKMREAHPVSLLCRDLSEMAHYASIENQAHRLIREVVPGPYTFILPATKHVPRNFVRRRRNVGLRVSSHPVVAALLDLMEQERVQGPLVVTSAHLAGASTESDMDEDAENRASKDHRSKERGGEEPSGEEHRGEEPRGEVQEAPVPSQIEQDFPALDLLLDVDETAAHSSAGNLVAGLPSTVLDLTRDEPEILRIGAGDVSRWT